MDLLSISVVATALAVRFEDVVAGLGEFKEFLVGGGVFEVPHFGGAGVEKFGVGLAEVVLEDL